MSLGVLAVGGLGWWAWSPGRYLSRDAAWYRALTADPVAAVPLLGRRPVRSDDRAPSRFLEKKVDPWIKNYFLDDGLGSQALRDEVIAYALDVGWREDPPGYESRDWVARRTHVDPDGTMTLVVRAAPGGSSSGPLAGTVLVHLL